MQYRFCDTQSELDEFRFRKKCFPLVFATTSESDTKALEIVQLLLLQVGVLKLVEDENVAM